MTQKSKSALKSDITSNFPTQHANAITASALRNVTTDMVDSLAHETGTVNIASGNTQPSVGFTSGATESLIVGNGLCLFGGANNAQICVAIMLSGVTGVAGNYTDNGVRVTQANGIGFSFLKFGRGFQLTPAADGSILIEYSGTGSLHGS